MTALTEPFPPWLRDLNRFFNSDGTASAFVPPADLLVDDGVTVPGVGSDHLDGELENDMLTVRGEWLYPYGEDGDGAARRIERGFGRFERLATGGTRDFSSVPRMQAERHEVGVDEDLAERAAKLLRSAV